MVLRKSSPNLSPSFALRPYSCHRFRRDLVRTGYQAGAAVALADGDRFPDVGERPTGPTPAETRVLRGAENDAHTPEAAKRYDGLGA